MYNPSVRFPRREATGQLDFADRETYVSAYLRTLAFGACEWGRPHHEAEQYSLAALTLNRGLASVEPVERSKWSDGILLGDRDLKVVALNIWTAATSGNNPNEILAALRAVEVTETEYVVFEFDLVTGNPAAFASKREPANGQWSYLEDPTRYEGGFYSSPDLNDGSMPKMLCETAFTFNVGRELVDLVPHVRLPKLQVDQSALEIKCLQDKIEMQANGSAIALWEHWYSNWEPACPREVHNLVGYKTIVKRDFVEELCGRNSLKTALWCRVKSGIRRYSYTEFQDQTSGFWIDV